MLLNSNQSWNVLYNPKGVVQFSFIAKSDFTVIPDILFFQILYVFTNLFFYVMFYRHIFYFRQEWHEFSNNNK